MSHRFRPRTALGAALAVVVVAAVPVSADAATKPPDTWPVPADAPTVATTPSGDAIIAWVVGGRTCTVVRDAGAPRPTVMRDDSVDDGRDVNGECITTPALSQFGVSGIWSTTEKTWQRSVSWGVAGPSVARLELRLGAKVFAASPAVAAPLPGPAAELRFWAIESAGRTTAQPVQVSAQPDEAVVLDQAGVVRRAFSPYEIGVFLGPFGREPESGTLLQRGRLGSSTWQLRRTIAQQLAPTPLQPERHVEVRCLAFTILNTGGGGSGDTGPCDQSLSPTVPLIAEPGTTCAGTTIVMAAAAPVRSAVAVLGDGTRRKVALHALGGARSALGGVLTVGPGVAIRRIEGLRADGRIARTAAVRQPPVRPDDDCSGASSTDVVDGDLFDLGAKLGAGPHVVRARDAGDELCVAVDQTPRAPADCAIPPLDPESSGVGAIPTADGVYLLAIVPTEVTAARITFADGSTQTVPAVPILGYAGQYASVLSQVTLDVPAGRTPRSGVLLDARGRVLGERRGLGTLTTRVGRPVTLRRAAGGLQALLATPVSLVFGDRTVGYTCVSFGSPPTDALSCAFGAALTGRTGLPTVEVRAHCDPQRLVVRAVLRRSTDRLVVRTRGGREIVAESLPIPARAGAGAGRYVGLAVVGPHEAVADIRLRGRAAARIAASYPAAADQCGYVDQPWFDPSLSSRR